MKNGQPTSEIGLYGLGVMGRNLALNIEENGFRISVYNRMEAGEQHLLANFMNDEARATRIRGFKKLKQFVNSLEKPRKIIMMIPAGNPVDEVIDQLLPLLDRGDIIIDGGNSNFKDTERRVKALDNHEIKFVGMGISGGEEGARKGPSLMPGGNTGAWEHVKPILTAIAAENPDGNPCCEWMGKSGAGHFVKMVHNGIEYADMQLLAECYHYMTELTDMNHDELASVFKSWHNGFLNSYLTEITSDIMKKKDDDGEPLLTKVLDVAGQKGTGKWTAVNALDVGVPAPIITQAVIQRFLSSFLELRSDCAKEFSSPQKNTDVDESAIINHLEEAFTAARIIAHHEGFMLIKEASDKFDWDINVAAIAKIWQGGCIIRSRMLEVVESSFYKGYQHILEIPYFTGKLSQCMDGLRQTVSQGVLHGIPLPGMSAALAQFDAYRSGRLPVSLIQAQRDCFGAHTYERTDEPRGTFFHSDWQSH